MGYKSISNKIIVAMTNAKEFKFCKICGKSEGRYQC